MVVPKEIWLTKVMKKEKIIMECYCEGKPNIKLTLSLRQSKKLILDLEHTIKSIYKLRETKGT